MQIPKRRGEWRRNIGPADEYLTPNAIQQLKDDLNRLEHIARPPAVLELQRTREMGDLSENAAYSEAKGKVMGIDSAIFRIKERLKYAQPVGSGARLGVGVGSNVTVEINGKQKTFLILGTQQTDPISGRISFHSPVGAALMGKKIGDIATVTINGQAIKYTILEIK